MKLSVIIPTYNRADILQRCLEHLANQTLARELYEVIVVDDGSSDHTPDVVKNAELDIIYLHQENRGQGIARNKAINKATGNIILFIGDDIFATPTLLDEHMKVHEEYPDVQYGCLGFIDWHPELAITPFMEWLTNGSALFGRFGGHQFAFEKLEGKDRADFNFFYTSNISIKKSLLKKEQFDHTFQGYGWEDIELGYRLHKHHEFVLVYNKDAIAHHYHQMEVSSMKPRMYAIGRGTHTIDTIHPELKKRPSLRKKIFFHSLSFPPVLGILWLLEKTKSKFWRALYYYALSKKHFLTGYYDGKKYFRSS